MPVTSLSINGVPHTDVHAFLREYGRFVEAQDFARALEALGKDFACVMKEPMVEVHDTVVDEPSVYDSYDAPTFEAVRMPQHEYYNDKDVLRHFKWKYDCKRVSKSKEKK